MRMYIYILYANTLYHTPVRNNSAASGGAAAWGNSGGPEGLQQAVQYVSRPRILVQEVVDFVLINSRHSSDWC